LDLVLIGFGYCWFFWILKRTIGFLLDNWISVDVIIITDFLHKDGPNPNPVQEQDCSFFGVLILPPVA
jgi:hypothetical protein